jgi:hypothetical protein
LRYKRSALLAAAMLVVLRRQEGFSAVEPVDFQPGITWLDRAQNAVKASVRKW